MSLHRLYSQLTVDVSDDMPPKAKASIEGQITELRKVAASRLILVVLDGTHSVCVNKVVRDERLRVSFKVQICICIHSAHTQTALMIV